MNQTLEGRGHKVDAFSLRCVRCGDTFATIQRNVELGGPITCPADKTMPSLAPGRGTVNVPTRRTRVYVSGPLTTGMLTANVRRAADIANRLLERGYAVYLPHTNVLWEMIAPPIDDYTAGYEKWLSHDFEWVLACDVLLRMEGKSHGADRELELAVAHRMPVYLSEELLYACEPATRPVLLNADRA